MAIHMKLHDFDYNLPNHLIATKPLTERPASRLLYLNKKNQELQHKKFSDILSLLNPGDLLVLNDTKVIPARLYANKPTGGKVEILVDTIIDSHNITAIIKSNSKLQTEQELILDQDTMLVIKDKEQGSYTMQANKPILGILDKHGHIPLPPYMQRIDNEDDKNRYQTVYATNPGAVAAPTAGLHFDNEILAKIKAKGVNIGYVTLHVGIGTFQNIRTENIAEHVMHKEYLEIKEELAEAWLKTKQAGKRVIAVGTTSVRSLESAWDGAKVTAKTGHTNLFITPGYKFNTIDALLTNFHLPKSTLIMLTCALGGHKFMLDAYKIAAENEYRFFSYGDAMFIE